MCCARAAAPGGATRRPMCSSGGGCTRTRRRVFCQTSLDFLGSANGPRRVVKFIVCAAAARARAEGSVQP
eukprot:3041398-Prymnesium_polylepis.1